MEQPKVISTAINLTKNQGKKGTKAKCTEENFSTHNTKLSGLRCKGKEKFSSTSQQKPEIMYKYVIFTPQMHVVDQRYRTTSSNPETRRSFKPWPIYLWGKRPWYPLNRRLGEPQNEM
jgi:hypothetical protein